MLVAAFVSAGLIAGVPVLLVGSMGAAAVEPRLALLLGAVAYGFARRHRGASPISEEANFHQAVTAELNGGASLRAALGRATERVPELGLKRLERAGRSGLPVRYLQQALRAGLANTGPPAAAALSILEDTGGEAISVFEGLALLAQDEASIEHDRKVSVAQVRVSAYLVGGLPLAFIGFLLVSGRFGEVARQAPAMLIVGGMLLGVGALWMSLMLRPGRLSDRRGFARSGSPDHDLLIAQLVFVGLTAGLSLEAALSHAQRELGDHPGQEVKHLLRRASHTGLAAALASAGGSGSLYRGLSRAHISGAPTAAAVATFIAQTREARKAAALARARRLPVKLLVPLSLFILPGFVFLTVGPTLVHSLTRVLSPLFG